MQNYSEAYTALNTAMNLMVQEDDTLLVAAISHPLHMAQSQLMLRRAELRRPNPTDKSIGSSDSSL